jgi:hypothetical protein
MGQGWYAFVFDPMFRQKWVLRVHGRKSSLLQRNLTGISEVPLDVSEDLGGIP